MPKMILRWTLLTCAAVALGGFLTSSRRAASASHGAPPAAAPSGGARSHGYGELPLSFEANSGQTDARVKFLARGQGYSLFLTPDEAVLKLSGRDGGASTLRLSLLKAAARPHVGGEGPLPGRSSYFIGDDARRWVTGVASFARVRYRAVYPGVDLVYYGNQGRLEYDFVVAPGANPDDIRLKIDGARAVSVNARGELSLRTAGGEIIQQPPVIYQVVGGARRAVAGGYRLKGRAVVGFRLGAYDRRLPLVIDPVLVYSTFLGGSNSEQGLAVAVDADGNAYVTGSTASADFPVMGGVQAAKGNSTDVFVAKLNATGTGISYATYLGGGGLESGLGIAVDAGGHAYVTGQTTSADFPKTAGALQQVRNGLSDAFVVKLAPGGGALAYATLFGGNNGETGAGIAVDAGGHAYVAGRTDSTDLGANRQFLTAGSALFKSAGGAGDWGASDAGMTASLVQSLAADPTNAGTLYAGTNYGVFKSADGGQRWRATGGVNNPLASALVHSIAVDPTNPALVYVGTLTGFAKSADGGDSYQARGIPVGGPPTVNALLVDPAAPATLYAGTFAGVYKSTDAGETWRLVNTGMGGPPFGGQLPTINKLAYDPVNKALYAATTRGMFKTTDGGASWAAINNGLSGTFSQSVTALAVDPATPTTLYAGMSGVPSALFKTTDGGATWFAANSGLELPGGAVASMQVNALAVDPANPAVIYAGTNTGGVFKSTDGAANWAPRNAGLPGLAVNALITDRANPANVFVGRGRGLDAFVAKLNATGSALGYALHFGGSESDDAAGVAVDAVGHAYVVGTTLSPNFPTASALQPNRSGTAADAFVAKVKPDGSGFVYATYLGGGAADRALAVAVNAAGQAFVTGQAGSTDFPTANALYPALKQSSDAFVARLKADGSALDFSTYFGGTGTDQGSAIALDGAGHVLLTGSTTSADFPLVSPFQPAKGGGGNSAFVTKLTADGSRVVYSTYLGGQGSDVGTGIGADAAGFAYVVGTASSPNFPTVNPLLPFRGGDAFVAKIGPAADLAVTLGESADPVNLGANLTYTITVTNNGELNATGVTLTDTLPAGAGVVSVAASQGSCAGAGPLTCNLGSLSNGARATVTVVITPPATTSITNTARVTGNEPDSIAANNTATETTQVTFADLSLGASALTPRAAPGSRVTYLATVTNNGGSTAASVRLSASFPPEVTVVSCGADGGACGGAGGSREAVFDSLPVGQSRAAAFVVTVNSGVAPGAVFQTNLAVSSGLPDSVPGNNSAAVGVTVAAATAVFRANGRVAFTAFRDSAPALLLYTVNPDGTGEAPFPNVTLGGFNPAWSPDGGKLAFQVRRYINSADLTEIYVINADGTGQVRVAADVSDSNSRLAWSPDGSRVAYVAKDFYIHTADAGGAGAARLPGSPQYVNDLAWSPDGRLAYVGANEIYVMNADGSGRTNLSRSNNQFHDAWPQWSPDGTKLLFNRSRSGAAVAHLMNADGGGVTQLLNQAAASHAAWSPDGTKIVYQADGKLYVMNFDNTGEPKLIATGTAPHWQPLGVVQPPPPPGQFFTLTGRFATTRNFSRPFQLKLTGTMSGEANLSYDDNTYTTGSYTFVRLPGGGNYTVTPVSKVYSFTPASRTYNNLSSDISGADFVATPLFYAIGGRITDGAGAPLAGVPVRLNTNLVTETDADGRYSFGSLTGGFDYYVQPLGWASNDLYQPRSEVFQSLDGDKTLNFVGQRERFVVAGMTTDANNFAVGGVKVTLTRAGAAPVEVTSDAEGRFTFPEQPSGYVYTATAAKDGQTFAPAGRTFAHNRPYSLAFYGGAGTATAVSGATYAARPVTPSSIISIFGTGFADAAQATPGGLPFEINGTSVTITDRYSSTRNCPLFYVSPLQINALVPHDVAVGEAQVIVRRLGRVVATGGVQVAHVSPGVFSGNADGQGPAAAVLLRVRGDGSFAYEPFVEYDAAQRKFVARPIDLGPATDRLYLELYGTGIRGVFGQADARVKIGGADAEVLYAGWQGQFAGLDQVNVQIPRSLAGRGLTDIVLTLNGQTANTVQLHIR